MTLLLPERPPRLLLPGLVPREPGLETWPVRPGGVTTVRLDGGDRLDVVDRQGRQVAQLTVLGAGNPLDVVDDAAASVLRGLAAAAAAGAQFVDDDEADAVDEVLAVIAEHGVDPTRATAARLFGDWSPAGDRTSFTATSPAVVLVAAPARPMAADDFAGNPPSDLLLEVRRAAPRPPSEPRLPPAGRGLVDEMRIAAATAYAYQVPAGHFIEITDVRGGQCSDFLAFGAAQLQQGRERGLDSTVTRTRMGAAVPEPGIFNAFFDQDGLPLVRIIRDTVGRHDMFALACTRDYYENYGYFGHPNCTDNFNEQLEPFSVEPRRAGWPALNLFYNTGFSGNVLGSDEPWSQPGDRVVLQAAQDLVCASSACPDDIDPANAWNPTEIHVRIYDPKRRFSVAMGHRVTPDAPTTFTKETAFHDKTTALGGVPTEYRGYWLPSRFTGYGPQAEYWGCRERAAVMDLSPLRKFEVLGPDAEALLQVTVTRNIRKLAEGQVVYSAMCNDTGGTIDDCTIFRMTATNFRFVGGDPYDGQWLREQAQRLGLDRVWVKDATDQLANLAVQGPASRELLAPLIWTKPTQQRFSDLTAFRFTVGRLGGPDGIPLVVSRTGYTGELGYELWVHPDTGATLWDAVWAAGQPHGLVPVGLEALDMLRIEAGLVFAGYEFCTQTDPFEAGIGFTVPLKSKDDDFVGRAALLDRKAHPQRTLVGLELAGNEPAAHGDCVHVGRWDVGTITSATVSPVLRKNIALCRIAVDHAEPGTKVEVGQLDGHRKRIPATVVPFPAYDPGKTRVRS